MSVKRIEIKDISHHVKHDFLGVLIIDFVFTVEEEPERHASTCLSKSFSAIILKHIKHSLVFVEIIDFDDDPSRHAFT